MIEVFEPGRQDKASAIQSCFQERQPHYRAAHLFSPIRTFWPANAASKQIRAMSTSNIKEDVRRLQDRLPEDLTWDDLMHEIYVRQSIEAGLKDARAGKTTEVGELRARFGLE